MATLTKYPYTQLGHANHGWLDARHHFSFSRYWNPDRTHFGSLRVINDDTIKAGSGFPPHRHDNMEIITYVRSGAITHRDSLGNEGRTGAGDVQVMSAGSGVTHSEYNLEDIDTTLYQIWISPHRENVDPRWDTKTFPKNNATHQLSLLVSGQPEHEGQGALFIHQDAAIYGGRMTAGTRIVQHIKHDAYILVSCGEIDISLADQATVSLSQGDGLEVSDATSCVIVSRTDAEILVIDVPV